MGSDNIAAAVISSRPASNDVCGANGVVVLTLNTSYLSTATYQWYKDGIAIPGANSILYSATTAGSYFVQVMDGGCSTISNIINVTYNSSGNIATPTYSVFPVEDSPGVVYLITGNNIEFTITNASAYSSPTFYWYKGDVQVATGAYFEASSIGTYKVLVVDGACASWSFPMTVLSNDCNTPLPVLAAVPTSAAVCGIGGSVLLQCSNRTAYTAPTYQWYKDGVSIGDRKSVV
jgi:hypothetical protein